MTIEDAHIPADLRSIDEALAQLGRFERNAAAASFEARLHLATAGVLTGANAGAASPDVAAVDSVAAELARRERSLASPGLEDRLFVLTAGHLASPTKNASHPTVPEVSRRVARWWSSGARIAALVALCAGAGLLWFASRPAPLAPTLPVAAAPSEVATLESDLDAWLAFDTTDELASEFDVIYAKAALLGDTLDADWFGDDLDSDEEEM